MSVIVECPRGAAIVCLETFWATPIGVPFSWDDGLERLFDIGEEVVYTGHRLDLEHRDKPGLGWLLTFRADDGLEYEALPTYFVSSQAWETLWRHFHYEGRENRPYKASA